MGVVVTKRIVLRGFLLNLIVSVIALALVLVAAESMIRLQYFGWPGIALFWRYSPRFLGSSPFLQASVNPKIRWELKPGTKGYLNGVWLEISNQGLRDREYPFKKPTGTFRIVVLGDSFTFGVGVESQETYPKVLERRLNEAFRGETRFEVINFGCGGYSTVDEVEVLKGKALFYEPDLVLFGFNLHDLYGNLDLLSGKLKEKPQVLPRHPLKRLKQSAYYFLINESFLYRFLQQRHFKRRIGQEEIRPELTDRLESSPEAWQILDEQFEELKALTLPRQLPVLLLILHDLELLDERYPFQAIHEKVAERGRKHDFFVLDFLPYFKRLEERRLWIYPIDRHPNARAHRIYADAVYETLIRELFPKISLRHS